MWSRLIQNHSWKKIFFQWLWVDDKPVGNGAGHSDTKCHSHAEKKGGRPSRGFRLPFFFFGVVLFKVEHLMMMLLFITLPLSTLILKRWWRKEERSSEIENALFVVDSTCSNRTDDGVDRIVERIGKAIHVPIQSSCERHESGKGDSRDAQRDTHSDRHA